MSVRISILYVCVCVCGKTSHQENYMYMHVSKSQHIVLKTSIPKQLCTLLSHIHIPTLYNIHHMADVIHV